MDIRKYIYGHCVSPIRINSFNAAKGTDEPLFVPCGECLHCKNQKVSEWVTRLYAHAQYCKNVYYLTLDYAPFDPDNSTAMQLAADTAAVYNNLNKNHHYGLQPIILCRSHLQKFFKRLRKNCPEKHFQYFACGEYGHLWSRPHWHILIFSNDTFTNSEFRSAWTLNGYTIGNVDFNDLRANGTFIQNKNDKSKNAKYVFSYVCKYLQKGNFDIESLKTIEYHKAYFKSINKVLSNPGELFPEYVDCMDQKVTEQNWKAYCKSIAPFVCCSKRPAIGLQYFKENVQRFQGQDFRLFGLPKECKSFPFYFIRKTKESLCGFKAIGQISKNPSSNSRIGTIVSVLSEIRDRNLSIETWSNPSALIWRSCEDENRIYLRSSNDSKDRTTYIDNLNLSFYDSDNRLFYYFTGFDFIIKQKIRKIGFVTLGNISIDNVITMLNNAWLSYYESYLKPMQYNKDVAVIDLDNAKTRLFGDCDDRDDKFHKLVYDMYNNELRSWRLKGEKINNTKILF